MERIAIKTEHPHVYRLIPPHDEGEYVQILAYSYYFGASPEDAIGNYDTNHIQNRWIKEDQKDKEAMVLQGLGYTPVFV